MYRTLLHNFITFGVITVVLMKNVVFWDMKPCT